MNKLVKCFKENICPYCKGNCDKGITFTPEGARCVDYERKEPIKKKKELVVTAKRYKPIMKGIV